MNFLFKHSISVCIAIGYWWRIEEVCYENGDYTPVLGSGIECDMCLKKKTNLGVRLHYYPATIFNGFHEKMFE